MRSCSIANHFIDVCSDTDDSSKNIRVIIIDQSNLSPGEINNLLLQKEIFWTSTLVITHNGLNSTHDWNRKRHTERPR